MRSTYEQEATFNEKSINGSDCDVCKRQEGHLERAKIIRKTYKSDVEKNKDRNQHYFSMDMQKIIMLPHLPVKTALFTRRILMINQAIAPVGGIKSGDGRPRAFLWHEGIRGRKDEDVASVVVKFPASTTVREYNDVTIWCDNCSGQNINRTLFSSIVHFLANRESDCMLNTVTLKFFEKGHTFMSADSFHHAVDNQIRIKKTYA